MSPLRWTTKSTRRLAETLRAQKFIVSKSQVHRLLRESGYQLAANRKSISGGTNPDRNEQFEFINKQSAKFLKKKCPVLSVDAKKKELIGNYKQNGSVWCPKKKPVLVKSHDFPDKKLGKALPYGIYDVQQNIGWVNVGIDHDTAEFAVASMSHGWKHLGKELYTGNPAFIPHVNSPHDRLFEKMQEFDALLKALVEVRSDMWSIYAEIQEGKNREKPELIGMQLTFYENGHVISWGDDSEHFSPQTFRLLSVLWDSPDRILLKDDFGKLVMDYEEAKDQSVWSCVDRARNEIQSVEFPYEIETLRGKGYRLTTP